MNLYVGEVLSAVNYKVDFSAGNYSLPISAGFEPSHAVCDVSGKAEPEYPSLEMISVANYDTTDAGHNNVKPADSKPQDPSTN